MARIIFDQRHDLIEEDDQGKITIVKKGLITKYELYNVEHVISVEEVFNKKGHIYKTRCAINVNGEYKILNHTADHVYHTIYPQKKSDVGFIRINNTKHKSNKQNKQNKLNQITKSKSKSKSNEQGKERGEDRD